MVGLMMVQCDPWRVARASSSAATPVRDLLTRATSNGWEAAPLNMITGVESQMAKMTAVGFEPTQFALVELESTPLDHSGKLSVATISFGRVSSSIGWTSMPLSPATAASHSSGSRA